MKYSELKRKLRKAGCYRVKDKGGHEKWYSPITNRHFWVPRHDGQEVKPDTLNSILKQAGLK